MDPRDTSTPGFAILNNRRRRSAISGRHAIVEPGAARAGLAEDVASRVAGSVDAIARGLGDIEARVEADATLDPVSAAEIRRRVAVAGAGVIDARYEGPGIRDETLLGMWDAIVSLENELTAARDRHAADAAEIARLRLRVRELAEDMHQTRRAHVIEQSANEGLHAQNDLLRVQLAETEELVRVTHAELLRTRAALAAAESRIGDLEARLAEQLDENDLMESWLNSALSRCAALQDRLWDLGDALGLGVVDDAAPAASVA